MIAGFFGFEEVYQGFGVGIGGSRLKALRDVESLMELRARIRLRLHQILGNPILAVSCDLVVSELIHQQLNLSSFALVLAILFSLLLDKKLLHRLGGKNIASW